MDGRRDATNHTVPTKSKFPLSIFNSDGNLDWSQKGLDFDHFGEILDLFRGRNLLFVSTV